MSNLLMLFVNFFKIGLFTIGGGYASLPLVEEAAMNGEWMSMSEFTDILTISQMTPGPFAINLATFVGLKFGGYLGGFVATFAFILPSFIIVSILAILLRKYGEIKAVKDAMYTLIPTSTGLIASAALTITILAIFGESGVHLNLTANNYIAIGIFIACFAGLHLLKDTKFPAILVVPISGLAGGILFTLFG